MSENNVEGYNFYDLEVRVQSGNVIAMKTEEGEMWFTHNEIEALYVYSKSVPKQEEE
ncbi:hypothetical protein D3C74_441040 [compost metagenome]